MVLKMSIVICFLYFVNFLVEKFLDNNLFFYNCVFLIINLNC